MQSQLVYLKKLENIFLSGGVYSFVRLDLDELYGGHANGMEQKYHYRVF